MKLKKIFALLSLPSLFFFTACQKDETEPDPEIETNFNLTEAFQITNTLSCATVNITPQNSFPKTIVIDFGNGCTSIDGVNRAGKINIVLSDSVHRPGATAVSYTHLTL